MKKNSENNILGSWLGTYARIGYISILFPASILIGYLAGNWIDKKINSKPIFTISLIILGFAAAIRTMLKEIDQAEKDENKK
jgi:F0F1-type ATP synthase assembly protein I